MYKYVNKKIHIYFPYRMYSNEITTERQRYIIIIIII